MSLLKNLNIFKEANVSDPWDARHTPPPTPPQAPRVIAGPPQEPGSRIAGSPYGLNQDLGQRYRPLQPQAPVKPNIISAPTPTPTQTISSQGTPPTNYNWKDTGAHLGLGLSGALRGVTTGMRDLGNVNSEGNPDPRYGMFAFNTALAANDMFDAYGGLKNKIPTNMPSAKNVGLHAVRGLGRQAALMSAVPALGTLGKGTWDGGASGAREALPQAAKEALPGLGMYGATKAIAKAAPRLASKFVPGLGSLGSAYSAWNRLNRTDASGNKLPPDYTGAALDSLSGVANFIPVGGVIASNLIDAGSAVRDMRNMRQNAANTQEQQRQQQQQQQIQEQQRKQELENDPKYNGWIKNKEGIPLYPPGYYGQSQTPAQPGRVVTAGYSEKLQKSKYMKIAENRFKQDLEDTSAGKNSDLYQAILPIISGNAEEQTHPDDAARVDALKEDVRKGLVGLEYMTGLKKNTGESFYDEHPAQAVATNLLGNYGKLGLGVGGAGLLANALRQHSNMKLTEPAKMSREGNPSGDATHPRNLLQPSKGPARPDVARLFGDLEKNPERRLGLLDSFVTQRGGQSSLLSDFKNAATPQEKRKILEQAALSEGHSGLEKYVDLHESLQKAKQKGGFKQYVGEKLHSLKPGPVNDLLKKLAPDSEQAIADLLEKYNITGAHANFDEPLIRDIVREYKGGKSLTADPQGQAFIDKTLKNIRDPKHQSSGVRRFLGRNKLPIAAGAAASLGSAGLYALIKAMQDKMYSKDKTNEWKKTLLQSRGDFDAAERIK